MMKKIGILLLGFFLITSLDAIASDVNAPSPDIEIQLGFNLINSKDLGNNFVLVNLKVNNLTDKHIDNAQAGCILKDENHAEISYETHYVIKSEEGGLAPHASNDHIFYLYNHYGDISKIKHILFQTESIKFK